VAQRTGEIRDSIEEQRDARRDGVEALPRRRPADAQAEYAKSAAVWDGQRQRLEAELAQSRG
jgi:hypothetical protein